MKEQNKYYVAGYCRLSKDDDIRSGDSSSIVSQKEMIGKYAKENGFSIHDFYVDDGYSGTNFQRPGFQRMIDDIEDGKINMVVTKDLSRLGRNYILTGQYTEMYFPSKNVRYISLNDGIDTINNDDNSIAPFINILNEFYARDISKKVRTAIRAKKAKGEYLGAIAPYGYQKDPRNKTRLIVEEDGAKIVKRIFEMARADMGSVSICKVLDNEGVVTPFHHRRLYLYGTPPKPAKWSPDVVIAILRNRTYLGETVQGKYNFVRFGGKVGKLKPKEEWYVIPGMHEPLVDLETWEIVQKRMDARIREYTVNPDSRLFAGLVKCEDCGCSLAYSKKYNIAYYGCGGNRRKGKKACTTHYIRKEVLEQVVLDDIRKYSKLANDKTDELLRQLKEQHGDNDACKSKALNAKLSKLESRDREINGILKRLYEDNVSGKLSDERFSKFLADYEKEQSEVQARIEITEREIQVIKATQKDTDSWVKLIQNYTSIEKLDRTVLMELVDKIVVGEVRNVDGNETRDIAIYYRFIGAVD